GSSTPGHGDGPRSSGSASKLFTVHLKSETTSLPRRRGIETGSAAGVGGGGWAFSSGAFAAGGGSGADSGDGARGLAHAPPPATRSAGAIPGGPAGPPISGARPRRGEPLIRNRVSSAEPLEVSPSGATMFSDD